MSGSAFRRSSRKLWSVASAKFSPFPYTRQRHIKQRRLVLRPSAHLLGRLEASRRVQHVQAKQACIKHVRGRQLQRGSVEIRRETESYWAAHGTEYTAPTF